MMDIHQILKQLPHRYPILLVDRVLEIEKGKRIKALKNVSINEPYFTGHFPHRPVMPGVLMLEAMAQAAALLAFDSLGTVPDEKTLFYFAGIDGARFKRPVEPGDQLIMEVSLSRMKAGIFKFAAQARVDGVLACEAELMGTVRTLPGARPGTQAWQAYIPRPWWMRAQSWTARSRLAPTPSLARTSKLQPALLWARTA
jgi:3-hydroxyacyl-[acyl-carrier-protein] dehydratase